MNRKQALAMLFAMYGQERAAERIQAYLIAFSDLDDDALLYALRQAADGKIGDPAFLPTAPQIVLAARVAPPPPVNYARLNNLPPIYEMLPNNSKRVTREAIAYFGIGKVSEWIGKTITAELLANESNDNLLICPPKSEETRQAINALIQELQSQQPKLIAAE